MKKHFYTQIIFFLTIILLPISVFSQNLDWVNQINDTVRINNLYNDKSGNIYVTGQFEGTVDFDFSSSTYNLTSKTAPGSFGTSAFLLKLDSAGKFLWVKSFGPYYGSYNDRDIGLTFDTQDNLIITGIFSNSIDLNPDTGVFMVYSSGWTNKGVFISKLNKNGNFIWGKSLSSSSDISLSDIASSHSSVDNLGNILITGWFKDTVDFDPGIGTNIIFSDSSKIDSFILKLDSNGGLEWVRVLKGNRSTSRSVAFNTIKTGISNSIYLVAQFIGSTDFDPGVGTDILNSTSFDVALLKLNLNGDFQWVGKVKSSHPMIELDSKDNIYFTSIFQGTVDFDLGPGVHNLSTSGSTYFNSAIIKIDSNSLFKWGFKLGDIGDAQIHATQFDNSNSLYLGGNFNLSCDFDPGIGVRRESASGLGNVFIMKMDTSGVFSWVVNFGGTGYDRVYPQKRTLCVDLESNVYLTGTFSDVVDFDPNSQQHLLRGGSGSAFIVKLSQDSCSSLSIKYENIKHVTCSDSGRIIAKAIYGNSPYVYNWETTPIISDSIARFNLGGMYELKVRDSIGCVDSSTVLINGPRTKSNIDLDSYVITGDFRTGFQNTIQIEAFNFGCIPQSGQYTLDLGPLVNYDSATNPPDLIVGNSLIWNFSNLSFDSTKLKSTVFVTTKTTAMVGDTVCLDSKITPLSGDTNTSNNNKSFCFPVLNGYDPNDKSVFPKGKCEKNYVKKGEKLVYTVRFQNTGNSEAINIHIIDSLDINFELNSLKIIGTSHEPYRVEILPQQTIKISFDSILLPDSVTSAINSIGYVIFEITPKNSIMNNTLIKNKAEIYFDFNEPIITNSVQNTVVDVVPNCFGTSLEELKLNSFKVYPNPNNGVFFLENKNNEIIKNILLTDINGKEIDFDLDSTNSNLKIRFNASSGIYFLRVNYLNKSATYKVIKN